MCQNQQGAAVADIGGATLGKSQMGLDSCLNGDSYFVIFSNNENNVVVAESTAVLVVVVVGGGGQHFCYGGGGGVWFGNCEKMYYTFLCQL